MNDIEKAAEKWEGAAQQANAAIRGLRLTTAAMPHVPTDDPDFYLSELDDPWVILQYHYKKLGIAVANLEEAALDVRRNHD